MHEQTVINPTVGATVLNPDTNAAALNHAAEPSTTLNPHLVDNSATKLPAGTTLAGKYTITESLQTSSGEADLYVCEYSGSEYIAKIYRRQRAVKPEVISVLKSIDSPFVARLFDAGEHNGLTFEILPYYKNGSLKGRTFSLDELKSAVIPCINEALRVLHSGGIIHKDLKPSNIMLSDDGTQVAVIDFGISSVAEDGATVLVTETGMTPEYSAPETFRSLFLEESDYYSFGITLYELYCGHTPYAHMSAQDIARYTAVQKIPFPQDMPKDLQDLISAVTYFDITNRNNKANPNRRWTYEEVKRWCEGTPQALPGEATQQAAAIPAYTFCGKEYTDIQSLVTAFVHNWEEGKKHLYRGIMASFFKRINPEIAGYCMDAEDTMRSALKSSDAAFWTLLYKLHPQLGGFCWKGRVYPSLPALGEDMLEKLWNNDTTDFEYWDSILQNKLLTQTLRRMGGENASLVSATSALEKSHEKSRTDSRGKLISYYTMAYLISGKRVLCVNNYLFNDISELIAYMQDLLNDSYGKFEDFCHKLIDYDDTLDPQLEAWLIALGKRRELNTWKESLSN